MARDGLVFSLLLLLVSLNTGMSHITGATHSETEFSDIVAEISIGGECTITGTLITHLEVCVVNCSTTGTSTITFNEGIADGLDITERLANCPAGWKLLFHSNVQSTYLGASSMVSRGWTDATALTHTGMRRRESAPHRAFFVQTIALNLSSHNGSWFRIRTIVGLRPDRGTAERGYDNTALHTAGEGDTDAGIPIVCAEAGRRVTTDNSRAGMQMSQHVIFS
jgi:hypothetical protein